MITTQKIKAMIEHWLATPVNGYFYQSYGSTVKEQLLKNTSSFHADNFIRKLKNDIPILAQLNDDELSIVEQFVDFETVHLYIVLYGNILIEIGKANTDTNTQQDYYNVTAS